MWSRGMYGWKAAIFEVLVSDGQAESVTRSVTGLHADMMDMVPHEQVSKPAKQTSSVCAILC